MITYRVRLLNSGKVERVLGDSYTIDPQDVLTIYRNNHPIVAYNKRGWAWIKSVTDD